MSSFDNYDEHFEIEAEGAPRSARFKSYYDKGRPYPVATRPWWDQNEPLMDFEDLVASLIDSTQSFSVEAACKGSGNQNFFAVRKLKAARRLCRECPVIVECANYALDNNESEGIWGGFPAEKLAELFNHPVSLKDLKAELNKPNN